MGRSRTESEIAAGKLVSAVQKEWGQYLGEPGAEVAEEVMNLAHELLQARSAQAMSKILGDRSVTQFLGETWVLRHPSVNRAIRNLEATLQ